MADSHAERSFWYDIAWPLLAGLVAGVGVLSCAASLGWLATAAVFALTWLAIAPTAWSVLTECGRPGGPALVGFAPACALAVTATVGLTSFGLASIPVMVLVPLTSPLFRRGRAGATEDRSERDEVRRQFDEIVYYGFTDDGSP
jgi:hypothetical protein